MTRERETREGERIICYVDEEIEDLIPGFLENRRNDVKRLEEALADGDYETIRTLGHMMKGAGGGYGFETISDIGEFLEGAAKEENTEEIRRQIGELSHFLDHVEVVYE
ncbi:MAG: Hpt domain-containing protein [Pseudomonadota bacterium]